MISRGNRPTLLGYVLATVVGVGIAGDLSAADAGTPKFAIDTATQYIQTGGALAGAAGENVAAPAAVSLDLTFLFEELERLAAQVGSLTDEQAAMCGGTKFPPLRHLAESECLRLLLLAERREWRLAAELAAQAYLRARQRFLDSLPEPRLTEAGPADDARARTEAWWQQHALTGFESLARIGREWIKQQKAEEAELQGPRIVDALRRTVRETAVITLDSVLTDSENDELSAMAAHLATVVNEQAEPSARLESARRLAAAYDTALAKRLKAVVVGLLAEDGTACLDLVPDDLRESLQPEAGECRAAALRLKTVAAATEGAAEEVTQALTGAFRERTLTLRLLLDKLEPTAQAKSCSSAIVSMRGDSTPANGDLGTERLNELADRLSRVAGLCLAHADAPFEETATQWVRALCNDSLERDEALAVRPDAESSARLRNSWSRLDAAMAQRERVAICASPAANNLHRWRNTGADGVLSDETERMLADLLQVAAETLDRQPLPALRPILDTIRVPVPPDDTLTQLETLRALCGLRRPGDSGRFEDAFVSALFEELGLAGNPDLEAAATAACELLGGPRRIAEMEDVLAAAPDHLTKMGDPAKADAALDLLRTALPVAVARIDEKGLQIARRVLAVGLVARAAPAADRVDRLGPTGFGCVDLGGARGLGAGLKIGAISPRLDRSDPDAWKIALGGTITLVICGADGLEGLRRVTSIPALSATLSLELPLDDERLPSGLDAVVEDWSARFEEAVRTAFTQIEIDEDVLRQELVSELPKLLQAAGGDLGPAVAVEAALKRWSEGSGIRYAPDIGLVLTFSIPSAQEDGAEARGSAEVCVQIPLTIDQTTEPTGCDPATEFKAVALRLVGKVFAPLVRDRIQQVGRALGLNDAAAEDLAGSIRVLTRSGSGANPVDSFDAGFLGVTMAAADGGGRSRGMRLRIPNRLFLDALKQAGLTSSDPSYPPLVGDLVIPLEFDATGQLRLGEVSLPCPDPRYVLDDILGIAKADAGVLAFSLTSRKSNSAGGTNRPCRHLPGLRVALGSAAPLVGTLGIVHVGVGADGGMSARFVPDDEGTLATRDGNWTFSYRFSRDSRLDDGTVTLRMRVTSRDSKFLGVQDMKATVRFNLSTGEWSLPSDDDNNQKIYGRIERGLSDVLPPGVRIDNLKFSSEGVRYAISGSWHLVGDRDAEAALATVARTGCELEKVYWLARLVASGMVPEPLAIGICDEPAGLEDEAEVVSGLEMEWDCIADGSEPGDTVRACEIEFPRDMTVCNSRVDIDLRWDDQTLGRVRADEVQSCLERQVEKFLPAPLADAIEIGRLEFTTGCANDPQGCGLATQIEVDLSSLVDDLESSDISLRDFLGEGAKSCSLSGEEKHITLRGLMTLEGSVRLGTNARDLLDRAQGALQGCASALAEAAARSAARKAARATGMEMEKVTEIAAEVVREVLGGVEETLEKVPGGKAACELRRRAGHALSCGDLTKEHLQQDAINGLRLAKSFEIASMTWTLEFDADLPTPKIEGLLNPRDLTRSDPEGAIQSAVKKGWNNWVDSLNPAMTLSCTEGDLSRCLDTLAEKLGVSVSPSQGDILSYSGGASFDRTGNNLTLRLPLQLKLSVLDVAAEVPLACTIDVSSWREPKIGKCGSEKELEQIVTSTLIQTITKEIEEDTFDLGVMSYTVDDVGAANGPGEKLRINGTAKLLAVEIPNLSELDLSIVFDSGWQPSIDADLSAFVQGMTSDLKESVNDVVGRVVPVKIERITVEDETAFKLPTAFGIESTVDIAGLFSISAPKLVLSARGMRISGPNRFEISFPDGASIPVPPLAICPTGGGVEDTTLIVKANITIGECTASHILKYQGQVRTDLRNVFRLESDGSLTLLSVLPLGRNEGVLDLSEPMLQQKAEIGGAVKDIIAIRGEFEVTGDPMVAKANGDAALFGVQIGEAHFLLDLSTGILDTAVEADLGFATGDGYIRTERRFARPRAKLDTEMTLDGFPLISGDVDARPRLVKVGVGILGLRLSLAFPGLEALTPSQIAKLIGNLLTPNFENLDEALAVLLSGDVTLNPFAEFGSGGDGLGGDGDGDDGESGKAEGDVNDPRKGLDREAQPPKADDTPPKKAPELPPKGEVHGGPLGQSSTPLWFKAIPDVLVQIGIGVEGAPDARVVAVATHDEHHFDAQGQRLGVTITVTDAGYSQLLRREVADGAGCRAGPGGVVYVYAGREVPLRGYYELCRIQGPHGPLTAKTLLDLKPQVALDLVGLNSAIAAELGERSPPPGAEEERLVLKGRLLAAPDQGLRGAIAFQRVGELLIAMRGRFTKGSCGNAATADTSLPWSEPRIFWVTGLGEKDLHNDQLVLDTVSALWGCPPGALARLDAARELLTTSTTISALDDSRQGFARIAKIVDSKQTGGSPPPPWVKRFSEEARRAMEETKREQERVKSEAKLAAALEARKDGASGVICIRNCKSRVIDVRPDGSECRVLVDGEETARFELGQFLKGSCDRRHGHAWVGVGRGSHISAITAGLRAETPSGLQLGAFVADADRFGETGVLALGTGDEGLTFDEFRLIQSFTARAAQEGWTTALSGTKLARHSAGGMAFVVEDSPHGFRWHVRADGREHIFLQAGENLTDEQREALIPLLVETPKRVEMQNGRLTLWFDHVIRVRSWSEEEDGSPWALRLELDRPDGRHRDATESLVLDDLLNRLDPAPAPRQGTVVPFVDGGSIWGYADWEIRSGNGTVSLRGAPDARPFGPAKRRTLTYGDAFVVEQEGAEVVWFDVHVPAGFGSVVLNARNQPDEESWGRVLCLFTPDGALIASNNFLHGLSNPAGDPKFALVRIEGTLEERHLVAAVRNFRDGRPTFPFVISLFGSDRSFLSVAPEELPHYRLCAPLADRISDPTDGEFRRADVRGIGLARTHKTFLRALTRTIREDLEERVTHAVFAGKGEIYAARGDPDVSMLEILAMGDERALSPVVEFTADGPASDLPPEHAWPRLAERLTAARWEGRPLRGSALELPENIGGNAWATVLPGDIESNRQTIFFERDGTHEVRVSSTSDDRRVLAAAIIHLLESNADRIDVLRHEPIIVAAVYPRPCPEDVATCAQSLVRLSPDTGQSLSEAAFDRRGASRGKLEAALDLFVHESDESRTGELTADPPFERNWAEEGAPGILRFAASRPFHVMTESGWAGCLSLEGLDWRDDPGLEYALHWWPEKARPRDRHGAVEDCSTDNPSHWTLTAGSRSVPDEAGGSPRRTLLLHATDSAGRMRLMAVPGQRSGVGPQLLTTKGAIGVQLAKAAAAGLADRLGPEESILAMTDHIPSDPASSAPILVLETGRLPLSESPGDARYSRLLVFYRLGDPNRADRICMLTGVEVTRPPVGEEGFRDTHRMLVEAVDRWLAPVDQPVCKPARRRHISLIKGTKDEWQIWERQFKRRTSAGSTSADSRRIARSGTRTVELASAGPWAFEVAVAPTLEPPPTEHVEVRRLDDLGPRVWIDARLYDQTADRANWDERQILLGVVTLGGAKSLGGKGLPAAELKLDCLDEGCLELEGDWGSKAAVGLSLGDPGDSRGTRYVLLRGSISRVIETDQDERTRGRAGLASRLARVASRAGGECAQVFDLRSSDKRDVHLAVLAEESGCTGRPVLRWRPRDSEWVELGDLVRTQANVAHESAREAESEIEDAILRRLFESESPRRFRVIPLSGAGPSPPEPVAILLKFENDALDLLPRFGSIRADGTDGPDFLAGAKADEEPDQTYLKRARALLSEPSASPESTIWLPGGETRNLAVFGTREGFAGNRVDIDAILEFETDTGRIWLKRTIDDTCELPRSLALRLLTEREHFGSEERVSCSTANDVVVLDVKLTGIEPSWRSLVGGNGYRARFEASDTVPNAVVGALARTASHQLESGYPLLSVEQLGDLYFATDRETHTVWTARANPLRVLTLGEYSGVEVQNEGHLALLKELVRDVERGPVNDPLSGSITSHGVYLALVIDGRSEIIAHQPGGPTIRVDLVEDAQLGEPAVDRSVTELLDKEIERSVVAGGERVAVAVAVDGNLLAEPSFHVRGKEEPVRFSHWPRDLRREQARPVSRFLLRLLAADQRFYHVHHRSGLLVACRTLNGPSARRLAEFAIQELDDGTDAGRVEWDRHACDATDDNESLLTEDLLDELDAIVHADLATTSSRLLGYSTKTNGPIALLVGESGGKSAKALYSVDASGPITLCEDSLPWKHPARDPLTEWLIQNGQCDWLFASDPRVFARAGNDTRLFERDRTWTIEPLPSDKSISEGHASRILNEEHAKEILNWVGTEDAFRQATCRSMRHGFLADPSDETKTRFLAAWVPCVGLAFSRGEVLKTTLRSTDHDPPSLTLEKVSWLVPYFGGASAEDTSTYELTVGEVLEVTATGIETRLFVWGEKKCAAVFPGGKPTANRLASIRDLLRDGGPGSTWDDPSFVRETWASVGNRQVTVLSRRKSTDCRKDFLAGRDVSTAGSSDYTHFASDGGHQPARWVDVELGTEPDGLLGILADGGHAAFESVFRQTHAPTKRVVVAVQPNQDVFYVIVREGYVLHKLFPGGSHCLQIAASEAEGVLSSLKENGSPATRPLDLDALLDSIAETFEKYSWGTQSPRWYSPLSLSDDPRHSLKVKSSAC